MSFNYNPSSVNGVVNAVNGSMAAATNLLKMQALIDESRYTRQTKLHEKMLARQASEENYSKLRLTMHPRDSSYYEANAGVEDEDERFKSMWSSVNDEHGNNRDLSNFLDKYKGGMGQGGYKQFTRDMDVALTRASLNAENESNDHRSLKTVTDATTGESRTAEFFDLENWYAKRRGLGLGGDKEYVTYMTKMNEKANEYLRGAGDKVRQDLKNAEATAKDAADAGKFQKSWSESEGGAGSVMSVGADGSATIAGAPNSPVLKSYNAGPATLIELNQLGASERDKSTGRGKTEHRSIQVQGTDANNQYIQNNGGTSALLGKLALTKLSKASFDDFKKNIGGRAQSNIKEELLNGVSPRTDIDPNALGEEIVKFINDPKSGPYAEELTRLLHGKSLTPEEAGIKQQGGGGSGTKHTSSSSSGIQDKKVVGALNKAAINLVPILNAQMKISSSQAPNREAFEYGSQLARDLKAKLLAYAQEDLDEKTLESFADYSLEQLMEDDLETDDEITRAFGNRIN